MLDLTFLILLSTVTADLLSRPRIIGGSRIDITDAPYQVSVRFYNSHHCGGAIISSTFILSAAHCYERKLPQYLTTCAGATTHRECSYLIPVARVINHQKFDLFRSGYDYDVSLLQLSRDIPFTSRTKPVNLPQRLNDDLPPGTSGLVAGWGISTFFTAYPNLHLLAVRVPVISQSECKKMYNPEMVTERMLCAGFKRGGMDSCQGDSGGPFVVNNVAYGVVSWGIGCAQAYSPGVYTKISALLDWIHENMNAENARKD